MFCLNIYRRSTPAYELPHSDLPIKNIMYVPWLQIYVHLSYLVPSRDKQNHVLWTIIGTDRYTVLIEKAWLWDGRTEQNDGN